MNSNVNRGPWTHRMLVWILSVVAGILIYWLLGFVVNDLGSLPGPDYQELEEAKLAPQLTETADRLARQIDETNRQIVEQRGRQQILRDSTDNSQTTMNQLLELARLQIEKGATPSDEERSALAESQQLFLENQRRYQELNEQISSLNDQLRTLETENRQNQQQLDTAREPIREEFSELMEQHKLRVAIYKLAFLIPLLLIAGVLYVKLRSSTYWALVYAFAIAVLVKVGFVMHEYFPARYFKYVLILFALAVAVRVLVYLLRMVAFPREDWLIKQYRDSYESFLCPICSHPIRRGPLKYLAWTRRSIRRLVPSKDSANVKDEPYTCPACATQLFQACGHCGSVRHSLLPACEQCGDVQPVARPEVRVGV